MISRTIAKLRDPEYRKAFVSSQINIGIPFQIRGLLQSRGWKQEDLVKRTGMLQPRISALLTPGKVRPNIETLRRLAEAFDCGLEVRFVPFGELVHWSESFNPEHFNVKSFDEEIREAVEREDAAVAALAASPSATTETNGTFFAKPFDTGLIVPSGSALPLDPWATALFGHLKKPELTQYNLLGDLSVKAKEQEIRRAA